MEAAALREAVAAAADDGAGVSWAVSQTSLCDRCRPIDQAELLRMARQCGVRISEDSGRIETRVEPLPTDDDEAAAAAARGWLGMAKVAGPHFLLIAITVVYVLLGALIIQRLEGRHFDELLLAEAQSVARSSDSYVASLWQLTQREGLSRDEFEKLSDDEWKRHVDTVYEAFRATQSKGGLSKAVGWDFRSAIFFTANMLTSIGYGFIVPLTAHGRLFCIGYCLIGIPLTLVTVANVAKFLSEVLFWLHREYVMLRLRLKQRGSAEERRRILQQQSEGDAWDQLQLYRFPPLAVVCAVVVYGLVGAYFLVRRWEGWSFAESAYFTFISILTVGFGDYWPQPENMLPTLCFIIVGILLSTMAIDILGCMYLEEIHNFGRSLRSRNPFYLIREAKMRRQRQRMAGMLTQLAKGLVFTQCDGTDTMVKEKKKWKRRRRRKTSCSDNNLFGLAPPDPPNECQIVSTSAYCVRLGWNPAFPQQAPVTYNIQWRQRLEEDCPVYRVSGISGCHYEIGNLISLSLYEFVITATNMFGTSKPVYLLQYTEPAIGPQHIIADKIRPNSIRLSWEQPFKKQHALTGYMVYHTEDCESAVDRWQKHRVLTRSAVFSSLKHDSFYVFCVRALFSDNEHSPLSRSVVVRTEKVQFNMNLIGHSKTIEIMENIADREESSPLICRDYYSGLA